MATLVSTGQITITDSNDYISTGATAPANPVAGVTLWVDTTVSPNQLKKWNGTSWEVVNEVQVGGRNFLLNSNFNKYAIGTTPAWDTSLNGTYGSIDNWSSGYNAGLAAPAVGYHAHLDTATFGYPVLAYIDRNTAYGYPHRWMGINQAFTDANSYVRKAIAIGVKITMSAEVYADTVGAKVQFGLYHYMLSTGTMNFEGLLVNTNAATSDDINKWVKRSITFTVNANWDTSKQFQVYVYGYTSSVECTNYVRNVKLELGNQATDWTVAQEDTDATIATAQTTANNAVTAAALAQTDATNALNKLTSITSDNILSASEKSTERSRWNDIANEKSGLNTQATTYEITAELSVYNSSFQSLANYLNAGTIWSSGVPSWLADSALSTDTTIVGTTYRNMWNAYFTARQNLLNAISAKAKALADAAQSTADNIQVGGRNLIRKSRIVTSSNDYGFGLRRVDVVSGQRYILSVNGMCNNVSTGKSLRTFIYRSDWSWQNHIEITETSAITASLSFIAPATETLCVMSYYYDNTTPRDGTVTVNWYKLELGNRATDWTPAPEDVQTDIDSKAKHFTGSANPTPPYVAGRDTWTNGTDLFECAVTRGDWESYVANDFVKATGYDNTQTVINGGLVTAGTIQLAGDASTILAGITGQGTAGTSVRIWAGGSYANRATANFRVTQAGDVYSKASYQVQNANNETNGGLSGEGTDAASIRAWFGATYANRASAPTRILQSGKLVATDIQLGNSSTGWNIGSYGNMTCFVGNSTIDNAYIVLDDRLRSGGFKNSAKIGTQVWSSASTIRGTAAFECNEANSVGPNIALYAKATNGLYNFSFRGEGKAVADSFIGCKQNTIDPSIDGSDIVFEKGNIVQIYNSSTSNYYVYLPSMSSIRSSLNIGSSIAFTIRLLVVVSRGSTAITLTTRSGTGTMYDHNGGTFTNFAMGQGDSIEFLGYSNGSYMEWQLLSIWD